jgi:predicted acetyltransferase
MRDAFLAVGDDRWSPPKSLEITRIALTDVSGYIDLLNDWAKGKGLPEDWVPCDEFWIVKGGIVVGSVGIRHRLNDWLRRVGGHIGYDVHPAYRNQGIATFALKEALKIVASLGVPEALITCSDDNAASTRVIEKCGGVRITDATTSKGVTKRRYVIKVEEPTA